MCADIRPDNVWRGIHGRELVLSLTILPPTIHNAARRKLRMIAAAKEVKDLRIPPGNDLEQLIGNLAGLWIFPLIVWQKAGCQVLEQIPLQLLDFRFRKTGRFCYHFKTHLHIR